MGSLKKMDIDGSNVVDIAEDINWFNMSILIKCQ